MPTNWFLADYFQLTIWWLKELITSLADRFLLTWQAGKHSVKQIDLLNHLSVLTGKQQNIHTLSLIPSLAQSWSAQNHLGMCYFLFR